MIGLIYGENNTLLLMKIKEEQKRLFVCYSFFLIRNTFINLCNSIYYHHMYSIFLNIIYHTSNKLLIKHIATTSNNIKQGLVTTNDSKDFYPEAQDVNNDVGLTQPIGKNTKKTDAKKVIKEAPINDKAFIEKANEHAKENTVLQDSSGHNEEKSSNKESNTNKEDSYQMIIPTTKSSQNVIEEKSTQEENAQKQIAANQKNNFIKSPSLPHFLEGTKKETNFWNDKQDSTGIEAKPVLVQEITKGDNPLSIFNYTESKRNYFDGSNNTDDERSQSRENDDISLSQAIEHAIQPRQETAPLSISQSIESTFLSTPKSGAQSSYNEKNELFVPKEITTSLAAKRETIEPRSVEVTSVLDDEGCMHFNFRRL